MRRVNADAKPDPRSYLRADRSRHGQLRHYVQIRDRLPKIRIRAEHDTPEFDRLVARAVESPIALYGDGTQEADAEKRMRVPHRTTGHAAQARYAPLVLDALQAVRQLARQHQARPTRGCRPTRVTNAHC